MKLRVIVSAIVSTLSLVAVVSLGWMAMQSWRQYQAANLTDEFNPVNEAMLAATGLLAAERGAMVGGLSEAAVLTPQQIETIHARRKLAIDAYHLIFTRLADRAEFPERSRHEALVKENFGKVDALRKSLDRDLTLAKAARDASTGAQWVPATTALIQSLESFRQHVVRSTFMAEGALPVLLSIQSSA